MQRSSSSACDTDSNGVCVSAPGKVLITGGYLVLDPQRAGLVLASSARFYAHVAAAAANRSATTEPPSARNASSNDGHGNELHVTVESLQFHQTIRGTLRRDGLSAPYQFIVTADSDRNAYIEETLLCAINGIEGVAPTSIACKALALQRARKHVHIQLAADNDFYSQAARLQAADQPLQRHSLAALAPFLPPFMELKPSGESVARKTGMGSSAALVTALVGALVCFFVPANRFDDCMADREVIHNLAQLSHCFVQRKIGSGFDVSAACFGSQRYTRFPASLLDAFTTPEALEPAVLGACVLDRECWSIARRVRPFSLPPGLRLFMGDVSAGSATVSMVRKVLAWQAAEPLAAQRVIASLDGFNTHVSAGFDALHALLTPRAGSDPTANETAMLAMAERTCEQWEAVDAELGAVLVQIRESFLGVRRLLREMGERAHVPIEPPAQRVLVDATMAIPGVLIAGVPGAGGFDAVFVVTLDASVLDRVEELWTAWPRSHPGSFICPLLGDIDTSHGLRRECWSHIVGSTPN